MGGLDLGELQVLVVEDNLFSRQLLRTALKGLGINEIREASDGADALKMLRVRVPDMVFIDWDMPGVDGVELTRLIRTAPDSPDPFLPVIMVTGHATVYHVVAARDAGVNEYLIKPFSAAGLFGRMRAVIERPRRFVRLKHYFGPDRRRHDPASWRGKGRRIDDPDAVLSQEQVDAVFADDPDALDLAPDEHDAAPEGASG